jgi:hypothetical protein
MWTAPLSNQNLSRSGRFRWTSGPNLGADHEPLSVFGQRQELDFSAALPFFFFFGDVNHY